MTRRVVIDTNVFISALLFGGLPGSLLDLALLPAFALVISLPILDELEEKLLLKFKLSAKDCAVIRAKLLRTAELVEPDFILDVIGYDPDDRVLECAVAGQAHFIVSGDRHLLTLKNYAGIPILTVRQFLDGLEDHP